MYGEYDFGEESKDTLFREVSMGYKVKDFLTNDEVGKFLWNLAFQHREQAIQKWEGTENPTSEECVKLQHEAAIPRLFVQWLNEALAMRDKAVEKLEIDDDDEGDS